ncbi:hypothetical protein GBA52_009747 [Prunus armeniaca]|nr:hypothetical protein GBA52_009747 [Prunus armeniaca]
MEEVQTSFSQVLTLTAEEAEPLLIEEEDDDQILKTSQVFSHFEDKQNVVTYAAWKFDKKLVLIEEPDGNVAPSKMNLKFADFWVQIHNIPLLKMTEKLAKSIGDRIGKCIDISRCEGVELVGGFMRIRVRVDITKPLQRGLRINLLGVGGTSDLVELVYEKLPKFCLGCRRISHALQDCTHVPQQQKMAREQPYGRFLTPRGYGQAQSSNSQCYESISEEEEENRGNKGNNVAGKQKGGSSNELVATAYSPANMKQRSSQKICPPNCVPQMQQ